MIRFSITRNMTVEVSQVENMADLLKVKRLPGREYDQDRDTWIIPVRPGVGAAIREVFGFETDADIFEAGEELFLELVSPPAPGTIDPFKVSASVAVELATLEHFYNAHHGDRDEYARIHAPYVRGE